MAKMMMIVDDIDGSSEARTIEFTVAGVSYEIDLNAAHQAEFDKALEPWIAVARRIGGRRTAGRTSAAGGSSTDDIREWARANGHEVKARGRVSAELRAAYEAAQRR